MKPSELQQQLTGLGATADEVAEQLGAKGLNGMRGKVDCCPIANYVKTFGFSDVSVDLVFDDEIVITADQLRLDSYQVPEAVSDFVQYFDGGDYPFLDSAVEVTK